MPERSKVEWDGIDLLGNQNDLVDWFAHVRDAQFVKDVGISASDVYDDQFTGGEASEDVFNNVATAE